MASNDYLGTATALLAPTDPPPFAVVNPGGSSPFLFIGDHAGNTIPASLGSLGLSQDELSRHIGWDIGIAALGNLLASGMNAVFIRQAFSRLVVDCNRHPEALDAIPSISDDTPIPGNQALTVADKAARFCAIQEPYQDAISAEIDRRRQAGQTTILIALHSFTPALRKGGSGRPWQIGVLHHRGNTSFAVRLLKVLRDAGDLVVGDNEPYKMDGIDYTVPRHAYPAGIRYAELEIRQDLLVEPHGQESWSRRLAAALPASISCSQ
jgi:predicted N-formylglutamate amidohydrolase